MNRLLGYLAVTLAAVLVAGAAGALALAAMERDEAVEALGAAVRAHRAERAVLDAQEGLAGADVEGALVSIRRANVAADRVAGVTERLVSSLEGTLEATSAAVASAREGAGGTIVARRETRIASELLAAIAAYQGSALDSADETNRALRRILEALRDTNRRFAGPGAPLP